MQLEVIAYGHTICSQSWGVSTGGEAFHRIYYMLGGSCECTLGGQSFALLPGNLYLLPRNVPYSMRHNPANPFFVLWQHVRLTDRDTGQRTACVSIAPQSPPWSVLQAMVGVSRGLCVENEPQARIDFNDRNRVAHQLESLCAALFALLEEQACLFYAPDARLAQLLQLIAANPERHYSVAQLAKLAQMERSYFSRLFRAQFQISAQEYLKVLYLDLAARKLLAGGSVEQAAEAAGYADVKAFSRAFSARYQSPPARYRTEKSHILQP